MRASLAPYINLSGQIHVVELLFSTWFSGQSSRSRGERKGESRAGAYLRSRSTEKGIEPVSSTFKDYPE